MRKMTLCDFIFIMDGIWIFVNVFLLIFFNELLYTILGFILIVFTILEIIVLISVNKKKKVENEIYYNKKLELENNFRIIRTKINMQKIQITYTRLEGYFLEIKSSYFDNGRMFFFKGQYNFYNLLSKQNSTFNRKNISPISLEEKIHMREELYIEVKVCKNDFLNYEMNFEKLFEDLELI